MQHCLEKYEDRKASIAPYFADIWGSLKYEVRNGESEDTIWATLEVLKTLATRLEGDNLRDYTLTVTRDCVTDLSNITYTAPSGRLLVAVLSANPSAFVMMVAPTITHVKDNLRHPKTPDHSQDLLMILHVVLETRLLLSGLQMTDQEKSEFSAIDSVFKNLYADVLKSRIQAGSKTTAGEDELKIAMRAVQAAGALIGQITVLPVIAVEDKTAHTRLLPDSVCLEMCNDLFTIFSQTGWTGEKKRSTDDVLNETTRALHRATEAYPEGFSILLDQSISIIQDAWTKDRAGAASAIRTLGPLLAFVGGSSLPKSPTHSLDRFLKLVVAFATELLAAIDAGADPKIRSALAAGVESVFRYFNDTCALSEVDASPFAFDGSWVQHIGSKYPTLEHLGTQTSDMGLSASAVKPTESASETRQDFLLVGLAIARQVYLRVTESQAAASGSAQSLSIRQTKLSSDKASEYQFLHHVSALAGFVVHEMTEAQQSSLHAEDVALTLFHDGQEATISQTGEEWDWLVSGDTSVLSFGILEALRPVSVTALVRSNLHPY